MIYAVSARVHPPAIGAIDLVVCAAHATEEHAQALLSAESKRQIADGFARLGRARPDWARSFVRWVAR